MKNIQSRLQAPSDFGLIGLVLKLWGPLHYFFARQSLQLIIKQFFNVLIRNQYYHFIFLIDVCGDSFSICTMIFIFTTLKLISVVDSSPIAGNLDIVGKRSILADDAQ